MLFAFDSTLTPAEVKKLLVDGAVLGARKVDDPLQAPLQIPVLNAYSSLRLAAQRSTAPLCGNRVYAKPNGEVYADRGPTAPPDKLFKSSDAPYADLLNSLHGGRRIQIGDYLEYKWSPITRTWDDVPISGNYHEDAGGAFLSWYDGTDHDATRYLVVNGGADQGLVYFTPQVTSLPGYSPLGAMSQVVRPVRNVNGYLVCSYGAADSSLTNQDCANGSVTLVGSSEYPQSKYALAPQGDFALIGINYRMGAQSYAGTYNKAGMLTPTTANWRDTSASIELWRVDSLSQHDKSLQASQVKLIEIPITGDGFSRGDLEISWLAIDETGTELVWQLQKRFSDYTNNVFKCTNRVIEYRALKGHDSTSVAGIAMPVEEGHLIREEQLPDLNSRCTDSFGPATFTPYRGSVAAKGARTSAPMAARGSRGALRILW